MSIRRDPTYLSSDIWRACWMIGQSESDESRKVTADEVADRMLKSAIEEKYPDLLKHFREVERLQRETIKKLGEKP